MQLNKKVVELPITFSKNSTNFKIKLLDYFNASGSNSIHIKNYPLFICLEPGVIAPSYCMGQKLFSIGSILGPDHTILSNNFPSVPIICGGKDVLHVNLLNKFGEPIDNIDAYISFDLTTK